MISLDSRLQPSSASALGTGAHGKQRAFNKRSFQQAYPVLVILEKEAQTQFTIILC